MKAGQPVATDVEAWFHKDTFQGNPHLVGQWADLHNSLAQAWVNGDPKNGAYVDDWAKKHPAIVAQFVKDNPATPAPKASDLAMVFFKDFSNANPGKFLSAVTKPGPGGKPVTALEPVKDGSDIQSIFFDMWRNEHADADLQDVPGDLVTTSASGLDPHISLGNAEFQLDRVAAKWAADLKLDPGAVRQEIEQILKQLNDAVAQGRSKSFKPAAVGPDDIRGVGEILAGDVAGLNGELIGADLGQAARGVVQAAERDGGGGRRAQNTDGPAADGQNSGRGRADIGDRAAVIDQRAA